MAIHSIPKPQNLADFQPKISNIPSWIIWVQCVCFALMYSIWTHPQTNFLSDLCMSIGALLSTYILYIHREFFRTRQALPFWILITLFAWVIFHLLFLSNNYELQFHELTSIWKRVAIAIIFALGFGVALSHAKPSSGQWAMIYAGMLMPACIFLFKYILGLYAGNWGWVIPDYLVLYPDRTYIFYLYKTDYTALCLPQLAICLAALQHNLKSNRIFILSNAFYLLGIVVTLEVFYLVGIRNGMADSVILLGVFAMTILNFQIRHMKILGYSREHWKAWASKLIIILVIVITTLLLFIRHLERSGLWQSLWADAKVAVQVDQIDKWKYFGSQGYPMNEFGNVVSGSNYERVAWIVVGLRLVGENPLGYGLVYRSFAHLTKQKWPESTLDQSHSAWLDLTLGIGIPGTCLVLGALILALYRAMINVTNNPHNSNQAQWSSRVAWVLWALLLLWCTSEISQKIHLIALLFWVSFAIGLSRPLEKNSFTQENLN